MTIRSVETVDTWCTRKTGRTGGTRTTGLTRRTGWTGLTRSTWQARRTFFSDGKLAGRTWEAARSPHARNAWWSSYDRRRRLLATVDATTRSPL